MGFGVFGLIFILRALNPTEGLAGYYCIGFGVISIARVVHKGAIAIPNYGPTMAPCENTHCAPFFNYPEPSSSIGA